MPAGLHAVALITIFDRKPLTALTMNSLRSEAEWKPVLGPSGVTLSQALTRRSGQEPRDATRGRGIHLGVAAISDVFRGAARRTEHVLDVSQQLVKVGAFPTL